MPAYADLDTVKGLLLIEDDDHDARLAQLNTVLSAQFDEKVRRTFAATMADQTRTLTARGGMVLRFPDEIGPVRSVTGITVGGEAVTSGNYRLAHANRDGESWAIVRTDTAWPETSATAIVVTAQWADRVAPIPNDVVETLNVLVAGSWDVDKTSPTGDVGPEGLTIRPYAPWDHDRVKQTLERWKIKRWVRA